MVVGLVNKIMTVKKYLKKSLFKENCKSYSKMLYLKTYFGHHSKNIFNFAKWKKWFIVFDKTWVLIKYIYITLKISVL